MLAATLPVMTPEAPTGPAWYTVRCVLVVRRGKRRRGRVRRYEERITLWNAESATQAAVRAEREARAYARSFGRPRLRLLHVGVPYRLLEALGPGVEVHSAVRTSPDKPAAFLRRHVPPAIGSPSAQASSVAPPDAIDQRRSRAPRTARPGDVVAADPTQPPARGVGSSAGSARRRERRARRSALSWSGLTPAGRGAWARYVLGDLGDGVAPDRPVA